MVEWKYGIVLILHIIWKVFIRENPGSKYWISLNFLLLYYFNNLGKRCEIMIPIMKQLDDTSNLVNFSLVFFQVQNYEMNHIQTWHARKNHRNDCLIIYLRFVCKLIEMASVVPIKIIFYPNSWPYSKISVWLVFVKTVIIDILPKTYERVLRFMIKDITWWLSPVRIIKRSLIIDMLNLLFIIRFITGLKVFGETITLEMID